MMDREMYLRTIRLSVWRFKSLAEGDSVEFEIVSSDKGPKAARHKKDLTLSIP